MCDFCNKIYNEDELNSQYCREVCDCITYDENNNHYNFWHECDDDYYTGNIMEIKPFSLKRISVCFSMREYGTDSSPRSACAACGSPWLSSSASADCCSFG